MMRTRDIRELVGLSLPLVLASASLAVNGFADGFFLARHSDVALRASLPVNAFVGIVLTVLSAVIGYSGTLFAQAHGGGRRAEALAASVAGGLMTVLALPILLLLVPSADFLFGIFGHAPDVLAAEGLLAAILLPGGVLQLVVLVEGGYFTGQGRTRLVGLATVVGSLVKLATTPLFVFGAGLLPSAGVAGVGYSFLAGQGASLAILTVALFRDRLLREIPLAEVVVRVGPAFVMLFRRGLPLGLMGLFGAITFFVLVSLLAGLDPVSSTASSAMMAVNSPFNAVVVGLTQALEVAIGRRSGAGDREGVRSAFRTAAGLALLLSLAYVGLLFAFGGRCAEGFLPADTTLDRTAFAGAVRALVVALAVRIGFEFVSSLLDAALRGVGRTAALAVCGIGTAVFVWLPATAVFWRWIPSAPAYWSVMILTSVLGMLARLVVFRRQAF